MILAPDSRGRPELLFIQRAQREGDRWSGHVAFPGGLMDASDETDRHTAQRECAEEVGLTLDAPIARLDDVVTGRPGSFRPLRVRPWVFAVAGRSPLPLEPTEVAHAFWVPLHELARGPRGRMWRRVMGVPFPFARVELRDAVRARTLWGLTLMMVDDLLRRAKIHRDPR